MTNPSDSEGPETGRPSESLIELVEELVGWWELNREGSVNRAYDYLDKTLKRLSAALPAGPETGDRERLLCRWRCNRCGEEHRIVLPPLPTTIQAAPAASEGQK